MSLFSKETQPQEESVEQSRERRERELLQELDVLEKELAMLRERAEKFRSLHMAIVNGRVCFISADLDARSALAEQWSEICALAGDAVVKRNVVLEKWSELCSSNPAETVHVAGKVVRRGAG